jgi:hypothetical protein
MMSIWRQYNFQGRQGKSEKSGKIFWFKNIRFMITDI